MSNVKITCPVPAARSDWYRAEGWWDGRGLADGIEAAALCRPDGLAISDNNRDLTYSQLARAVDAGVATLAAHGVGTGTGVILVAGNTVASVVAYHSIVRIGATAVVLDRRCGPSDISFAAELLDSGAAVIVPEKERERLLGGPETAAIQIEAFGDLAPPGTESGWNEPSRDSAAVVLFTSGTTGRPKAVVHSLNTLTAGAANMARITAAGDHSVLFLVSPLTSIAGIMQMHLAADCHGAIVLEDRFDPEQTLDRINAARATILGGAPVIAERLLRAASQRRSPYIALRTLALGGAMLPRPLLEKATVEFGIEIARVYGSSEAPNFSGSLPEDDPVQRLSDDGALMPGSELRTRLRDGQPEGMLKGPGLFLGYADTRDNAESFEGSWFRSGDLVEVNGARLTVVGRLKDVVNRNGLKISLSEIDDALAGLPGVREQACFAMPDPETGERLAVAVVAEEGVKVTLDRVVAYLLALGTARRKLPEELVLWDGPLPRTESGKVIRSRLVMDSPANPSELAKRAV
jgi:acyl-CoA synthetase (AMP-forming)/AMP-acid ligase II